MSGFPPHPPDGPRTVKADNWKTALALVLGIVFFGLAVSGAGPRLVVFLRAIVDPAPAARPVEIVPEGEGEPRGVHLPGAGIYLAPFTGFPQEVLRELQIFYEQKVGLDPEVLEEMDIEPSARPPGESQLDAFDLDDQVARSYVITQRPTLVIGYVTQDIRAYETGDFWNFGAVNEAGYAVISTARMDPRSFGQRPDWELVLERLRKMTTRYIAEVYYGFPRSSDPRSVLYDSIRSHEDLDRMTEWPCPTKPGQMVRC